MKRSHASRSVLVAILGFAATACEIETGLGITWDCCGMGGGGTYEWPFSLNISDNILVGDTTHLSTFVGSGDASATWLLTGPAVFVSRSEILGTHIETPTRDVAILGTGTGEVRVRASRVGSSDTAVVSFLVANPSEVTLRVVSQKSVTIRPGQEAWVVAHLLDAVGRYYRGPFVWTSSDTSVVVLADGVNPSPFGKVARARAVGSARVVLAALNMRDSVIVTVAQ